MVAWPVGGVGGGRWNTDCRHLPKSGSLPFETSLPEFHLTLVQDREFSGCAASTGKAQVASHSPAFCIFPGGLSLSSLGSCQHGKAQYFSYVFWVSGALGRQKNSLCFSFKIIFKEVPLQVSNPQRFPNAPPCLPEALMLQSATTRSLRSPSWVQAWRCRLSWRVCGHWKLDFPQMSFLRSYFRSSAAGATDKRTPRDTQRQGQQWTWTLGKEF